MKQFQISLYSSKIFLFLWGLHLTCSLIQGTFLSLLYCISIQKQCMPFYIFIFIFFHPFIYFFSLLETLKTSYILFMKFSSILFSSFKWMFLAQANAALLVGQCKVAGSILVRGHTQVVALVLGWGTYGRQLTDVSLSHMRFTPPKSINVFSSKHLKKQTFFLDSQQTEQELHSSYICPAPTNHSPPSTVHARMVHSLD